MRKSKFSAEEKLKWVKKYLNGEKSCADISKECCVAESTLRRWVNNYTAQGRLSQSLCKHIKLI